ncbi:hypothetical protein HPB48_018520 [Haemaphysalis longicornis]|uniref:Palmitoyltransferase n=1 Tax=Haemaphysalis longicornis TaxID=44386 RepID=A0A9J6GU11_HAELO|nr:hypothetical protein HPB48_018520 [Haemaphysalis longicornis]
MVFSDRCVTKMDHHCPWFNNCVSFSTYKFFLLTLFYLALLGAYVASSVSIYMWHLHPRLSLTRWSLHLRFLGIVGALSCLTFGCFFYLHLWFVARNRTSLEAMRPPVFLEKGDSFDLGTRRNFLEVFGADKALWAFPVSTSLGDGSLFPTRLHPNRDSLLGIATALPHPRPTGSIAMTTIPEVAVHAVSAASLDKGNLAPVTGTRGGGSASSTVLKMPAGATPKQCPVHDRLPASVHHNALPQAKLAYIPTRSHTVKLAAEL